jgi:hypothetical protein
MSTSIPGTTLDSHFEIEFPLPLRSKFRNLPGRDSISKDFIPDSAWPHARRCMVVEGVFFTTIPRNALSCSTSILYIGRKTKNCSKYIGVQCSCSSQTPVFCKMTALLCLSNISPTTCSQAQSYIRTFSFSHAFRSIGDHRRESTTWTLLLVALDPSLYSRF